MDENKNAVANEVLTTAQVKAEESLAVITAQINSAMDSMQYGMYEVAGLLGEASKYIAESKYKTLGAYAEENFGFKKSRASQLKTVADRFLEKKEDENGNTMYVCKLDTNGRPWTVDALYFLSTKCEDEEVTKLIASNTISSNMSNKAIIDALSPKKAIEKKEDGQTATDGQTTTDTKEDAWNTEMSEIFQLACFVRERCEAHASSKLAKEIINSVNEIIKLSDME